MFQIALNAGHYLNQAGKRCLASIDPKETREWWLNDRICDKVEKGLAVYSGYTLLRIDDTSGQINLTLKQRTNKANDFQADIYVSVHHNAGINGGSGGGIIAFTYTSVDDYTKRMQKLFYDKLIQKTGLKGNRSVPLATADFAECRDTNMPAVLLECGFMDSTTDTPVILTDDYATKAASAIVESIAELGGLTKKGSSTPIPQPDPTPETPNAPQEPNTPELPTTPENPDAPTTPNAPVPPNTSEDPEVPDDPINPPEDIVTGTVKANKHPIVKTKPCLFSEKIGALSPGQKVTVKAQQGKWYVIDYNGKSAYVEKKHLQLSGNL